MNRTLLAAVLTLGSFTAAAGAFAQAPADASQPPMQQMRHAPDPHKEAMHLSKKLGLSPDQTARIEPILAQHRDGVTAIQQNTALSPEQKQMQMRELNRNTHQQMAAVLTPDQLAQLKAMHKQHHMQMQQQEAPMQTAPSGL